mgnify:CR=1 FL=1
MTYFVGHLRLFTEEPKILRGKFLRTSFGISSQYFKIFFVSFPFKPDLEEKITRMHTNLVKFDDSTLQTLEQDEPDHQDVTQMREMVNVALTKFNQFEAKRKRK